MFDRTVKILLIIIALGLWTMVAITLAKSNQDDAFYYLESRISDIEEETGTLGDSIEDVSDRLDDLEHTASDVESEVVDALDMVEAIEGGYCSNRRIC